jgi:hypothetical protein
MEDPDDENHPGYGEPPGERPGERGCAVRQLDGGERARGVDERQEG